MSTSGTVSTTVFKTRKVVEHAFRRCRVIPQKISAEDTQTALDLLYLFLSSSTLRGIALHCVQKIISPLYENAIIVPMPVGTLDLLNCNLRTPQRLSGTYTASSGTAASAFDGDTSTACTQGVAGGNIRIQLESGTSAPIFGILPNASATWSVKLQGSMNGSAWTDLYANTALAVVSGEWQWIDVDGVLNYVYYRLLAVAPTTLNVTEFFVGTSGMEVSLFKMNRDDYSNLSNKAFPGRPTQFRYDRQRDQPVVQVWPAPSAQFTFSHLVSFIQRHIQDVGTMQGEIEVPQRWYFWVVCELARQVARELPALASPEIIPQPDLDAREAKADVWDGETDSSKTFLRPNISAYTR